jgi:hypothetical protein
LLGDALLGGQPAQQAGQLDAFGRGQGGADLVLVAATGGLHLGERVAALRGQVQRVGAAVGWVAPAFDQAALLELVDQEDHPGGVEPDELAEGLLRQAFVGGQSDEHSSVARLQAERREPFAELPGQVHSELHQQEGEVPGVLVHWQRLSLREYSFVS